MHASKTNRHQQQDHPESLFFGPSSLANTPIYMLCARFGTSNHPSPPSTAYSLTSARTLAREMDNMLH